MSIRLIALFLLGLVAVAGQAPGAQSQGFDMADVIRSAATKHAATQKVDAGSAVRRLDDLLVGDYGASGRIANERDPVLKSLYTQAARLLMNGNAIAGGTMVVIASQEASFRRSAVGPALQSFVGIMLTPADEEDTVLAGFTARADRARAQLRSLRPELQMAAQLRVMGAIYNDAIAMDAGDAALSRLSATEGERAVVAGALNAAGVK